MVAAELVITEDDIRKMAARYNAEVVDRPQDKAPEVSPMFRRGLAVWVHFPGSNVTISVIAGGQSYSEPRTGPGPYSMFEAAMWRGTPDDGDSEYISPDTVADLWDGSVFPYVDATNLMRLFEAAASLKGLPE